MVDLIPECPTSDRTALHMKVIPSIVGLSVLLSPLATAQVSDETTATDAPPVGEVTGDGGATNDLFSIGLLK